MLYGVMFYIDTAAGEASALVEEYHKGDGPIGAIGSNWQMGPEFATREEAEAKIAAFREEMKADGYTWVGRNTAWASRF